ncbi:MAG: hypothetical protein JRJ66_02930 [Deltaproteobacteria bacterium]|nr:hypothetical protein [Deltaproteobacteria bacterium]
MISNKLEKLDEPELMFGYNQTTFDPRDGLTLFGPFTRTKVTDINIGIIGTRLGIKRLVRWLERIQKPVKSLDNDIARPFFPGFESVFEIRINFNAIKTIEIDRQQINEYLKYTDGHVRIFYLVTLYADELVKYGREEEEPVQVWFVVIPDDIYMFGRPKSRVPVTEESVRIGLKTWYSKTQPTFIKEIEELQQAYLFEKHFHNQLKARLLKDKIITQVVRESTIAYKDFVTRKGKPKRDLAKFESAIAWNLSTALYYKVGGLPWKLAKVREGVCYVGLVYKRDETARDEKTACCAAQMFLDSGDGLVFRGNIGPWFNPENKQYHLSKDSAYQLLDKALQTYYEKNNFEYPKEMFIHAKTYFDDEEWNGFVEACNNKSNILGIRIRDDRVFKLFRDYQYPILRNMMYQCDENMAFLFTRGFIPRLETVLGLETPNPLSAEICRGDADLRIVCQDILALTKLNYNTCIYGDGKPVTLRFADMIGEILTAGPTPEDEVLPFKHYI